MTQLAQDEKSPSRRPRRILAGILGILSLTALALVVLVPPWREVEHARAARRTAEPFIAARRVIEPLLEYRRYAGEWVAGTGRIDSVQLTRQAEQVESLLQSLESSVCQPGFDESRRLVMTLRSDWETIRRGLMSWAQNGDFAVYAERAGELLNPLRQLASAAARRQPEVQLLAVLVADIDDLSQMAFAVRHAARSRRFERETQSRISRLLGRLESRQTLLPSDLHSGERFQLLQKLENEVLRDPVPVDEMTATALTRDTESVIRQELQRTDAHLAEWSETLDARIAASRRHAILTAFALLAAMVAALGAFYLLLRSWLTPLPTSTSKRTTASRAAVPDVDEAWADRLASAASELDEAADEAEVIVENASLHLAAHELPIAAEVDRCLEHLRQLRAQITRIQSELSTATKSSTSHPQPVTSH